MNTHRFVRMMASFAFILVLVACNLPQPAQQATQPPATQAPPTQLPATQPPVTQPAASATTPPTAVPPTAVPPTAIPPTATATTPPTQPPPTATLKPTTPPKPTATPVPPAKGYALFDKTTSQVRGYNLANNALLFKYIVPGETYLGFGDAQVIGENLFYFSQSEQKVIAVNKGGAVKLNFIPKAISIPFAVSPDAKKIAWATDDFSGQNPGSALWVAGVDGSNAKKIASIDPASNSKWLVLRPYKWLADGRLLYTQNPTGIGGYILFYGFAGIYIYDPKNISKQPATAIYDASKPGAGFLCLKGIEPGLLVVVSECATKTQGQLSFVFTSSGKPSPIPVVDDQVQSGSVVFSPSGNNMAYAVARGDPDNEAGQVLVQVDDSAKPDVIAKFGNGYVQVCDWIDENTLMLESFQGDKTTLWTIQRTGKNLVKVAEGDFIGLIH